MRTLTRTEKIIIKSITKKEQIPRSTVIDAYRLFLCGAKLPPNHKNWQYDLWTEAQERKHFGPFA